LISCAGTWTDGKDLAIDPIKAGNMLRLINDFTGMPGNPLANVVIVEVFDRATLRPHILFFTVVNILAGTELLLDYGEVTFTLLHFWMNEVRILQGLP